MDEPSNGSSTQIRTIHQRDAVKNTDCHHETTINAVDDLSLLRRGKLALVLIRARAIKVDVLFQARWPLLKVVVGHGSC